MHKKVYAKYGIYHPKESQPYKISRSKIDLFLQCPKCFYLDRRFGIKRPEGPPFNLNKAVDKLLKKEFDIHRARQTTHPLMKQYGIMAVPFEHHLIDEWRENFCGVQYLHEPTNLLIFGAVDDIWHNSAKELMVVDYKATSKAGEVNIDAPWQMGYKRQMEVYQWLLRKNDLKVSDKGYFVYCNGRTDAEAFDGKLEFEIKIIEYVGSDGWVEPTIIKLHKCLNRKSFPKADKDCVFCKYREDIYKLEK